ncbi:MAG: hypothetical protein OEU26_03300 [Candidatus Tectomicrobia bacterium]|nr:hypothetical protein [Candidatus Tectomicrobia bacterium]
MLAQSQTRFEFTIDEFDCPTFLVNAHDLSQGQLWKMGHFCLSWDEAVTMARDIGLEMPEVWVEVLWDERIIRHLRIDTTRCEGDVIRPAGGFAYDAFDRHVAKWVREEHLQNRGQPHNRVVLLNHLAPEATP